MEDDDEFLAAIEARIGTTLNGKYTLKALLGVGGMAAVYLAIHRTGRRCAIKMLHKGGSATDTQIKRFRREAYAANALEHPGIVEIQDDDISEDGAPFLVMELLRGRTLSDDIESGGILSEELAFNYLDQCHDALGAAHAAGIFHRDIKPDNIFLLETGRIKLLDFGIATLHEDVAGLTVKTEYGTLMGTPGFMAPEQARGRWDEVDGQSDIWALSATFFQLVSGQTVHEATTRNEALGLAMVTPARSLRTVSPQASSQLVTILDRALPFEKKDRFADAYEMQVAVRDAAQELGIVLRPSFRPLSGPRVGSSPHRDPSSSTLTQGGALSVNTSAATELGSVPPKGKRSVMAATGVGLTMLVLGAVAALTSGGGDVEGDGAAAAASAVELPVPTGRQAVEVLPTPAVSPVPSVSAPVPSAEDHELKAPTRKPIVLPAPTLKKPAIVPKPKRVSVKRKPVATFRKPQTRPKAAPPPQPKTVPVTAPAARDPLDIRW
ncbi:MAG: protein kinase [Polyangiaceae bacterium]|nr:protein kinase [Polyangiaceae bacterium]